MVNLQPMTTTPSNKPVLVSVGSSWILGVYCKTRLGGAAWYELRTDSTDKNFRLIPFGKITKGKGWIPLDPDSWK